MGTDLETVLDVASIGDLETDLEVMHQILSTDLVTVLDVASIGDLEVMHQILSTDLETVLDVASIRELEVMHQILSTDQGMDLVEKIEPGDQVERMKVALGASRGVQVAEMTEDPDEMIFLLRQNDVLTTLPPLS